MSRYTDHSVKSLSTAEMKLLYFVFFFFFSGWKRLSQSFVVVLPLFFISRKMQNIVKDILLSVGKK